MTPSDEVLSAAMHDACMGKSVLFLTPNRDGTDLIVRRAIDLAVDTLHRRLGMANNEIRLLFRELTSRWHWAIGEYGRIFFFPEDEIEKDEPVNTPEFVYYPKDEETYMKDLYPSWRKLPPKPKTAPKASSIWDLLNLGD